MAWTKEDVKEWKLQSLLTHVGSPVDGTAVPLVAGIDVCTSGEQQPHHLTTRDSQQNSLELQPEHFYVTLLLPPAAGPHFLLFFFFPT